MKTMTTPAMPMIATADEPSRWRIERRVDAGDRDDLGEPIHDRPLASKVGSRCGLITPLLLSASTILSRPA